MPDPKDEAQAKLDAIAPKPGRYRHYKGGEYEVILCAIKEDTLEPMVIYKSLAHGTIWVRPIQEWNEEVEVAGQHIRRFTQLVRNNS